MLETVMVELDETPERLLDLAMRRDSGKRFVTVQDRVQYIQEVLDKAKFVCKVRQSQSKSGNEVLVDVEDSNDNVLELVTDKLDEIGVRCVCYAWDNGTNSINWDADNDDDEDFDDDDDFDDED